MNDVNSPPRPNSRVSLGILIGIAIFGGLGVAAWIFGVNRSNILDDVLQTADENPAAAERNLRQQLDRNPSQKSDISLALAWLDARRDDWDDANLLFNQVETSTCRTDLLFKFASKASRSFRFKLANRALKPLRDRNVQETPEALQLLWKNYSAQGESEEALHCAKELLNRQPSNHAFHLELIKALKAASLDVECLDEIQKIMQFDLPRTLQVEVDHLYLDQLIILGNLQSAWKQVETIRSRYGNSTQLQTKLIDLYRAEGKLDQALEVVTEIFPHVKQIPAAYLTRGSILLDLGRSDEAIVDLEKSTELEPYNERSQFKLSEAYRSTGKASLSEKHRQLGERIRRNRVRIGELMKELSHAGQRDFEELSSLHLGLGAAETARYWKQRAQIIDK